MYTHEHTQEHTNTNTHTHERSTAQHEHDTLNAHLRGAHVFPLHKLQVVERPEGFGFAPLIRGRPPFLLVMKQGKFFSHAAEHFLLHCEKLHEPVGWLTRNCHAHSRALLPKNSDWMLLSKLLHFGKRLLWQRQVDVSHRLIFLTLYRSTPPSCVLVSRDIPGSSRGEVAEGPEIASRKFQSRWSAPESF